MGSLARNCSGAITYLVTTLPRGGRGPSGRSSRPHTVGACRIRGWCTTSLFMSFLTSGPRALTRLRCLIALALGGRGQTQTSGPASMGYRRPPAAVRVGRFLASRHGVLRRGTIQPAKREIRSSTEHIGLPLPFVPLCPQTTLPQPMVSGPSVQDPSSRREDATRSVSHGHRGFHRLSQKSRFSLGGTFPQHQTSGSRFPLVCNRYLGPRSVDHGCKPLLLPAVNSPHPQLSMSAPGEVRDALVECGQAVGLGGAWSQSSVGTGAGLDPWMGLAADRRHTPRPMHMV